MSNQSAKKSCYEGRSLNKDHFRRVLARYATKTSEVSKKSNEREGLFGIKGYKDWFHAQRYAQLRAARCGDAWQPGAAPRNIFGSGSISWLALACRRSFLTHIHVLAVVIIILVIAAWNRGHYIRYWSAGSEQLCSDETGEPADISAQLLTNQCSLALPCLLRVRRFSL